jgi:hypothetical protein
MRRTVMMVMRCAALAMPMVAIGDDQTIPPEAHWTPTAPVRSTAEVNQLASELVDTGMMSPEASTPWTYPQMSSPSPHSRARAWTWDDIDYNRVRSTGGD